MKVHRVLDYLSSTPPLSPNGFKFLAIEEVETGDIVYSPLHKWYGKVTSVTYCKNVSGRYSHCRDASFFSDVMLATATAEEKQHAAAILNPKIPA
jgi:hypothetical protein